jgi:uncharacterized protein (DUF2267 family)
MTRPYDVEHATKQYQDRLAALKDEASLLTHNQSQAMMRAVMHQLRRSLTSEHVLRIANALPALPRGILLQGWPLDERCDAAAAAEEFYQSVCDHEADMAGGRAIHAPGGIGGRSATVEKNDPASAARQAQCSNVGSADFAMISGEARSRHICNWHRCR